MKIGIFGAGKIAEKHIAGYQQLDNVELCIHDTNPEKRAIAEKFNIQWVEAPLTLFQDDTIDAIDVCTPTPFHAEIILQALECKKPVICEKPLAMSQQESQRIYDMAKKTNGLVYIGFPYRFHPAFQTVKTLLDTNVIGKPHFALFRLGGKGSHQPWKHIKKAGGGAANEMLVHMLDLAQWYFKDLANADCLINKTLKPSRVIGSETIQTDAEDLVLLNIQSQDGVEVLCQSDFLSPGYMNTVEIHGDNGSVFTSILSKLPTIVHCNEARGEYPQGQTLLHFEPVNLFTREMEHFIHCCRSDQPHTLSNLVEAMEKQALLDLL